MNASRKIFSREKTTPPAPRFCDISVVLPASFRLASGEALSKPEISLRVYGELWKPVIIVAGGISAGKTVADEPGKKGWWRKIVKSGGAVDLDKYCVVTFDFLPNAEEIARTFSTIDQAAALRYALEIIQCNRVFSFIGASYGAMVALAFAQAYPALCENYAIISASDKAHPAATALRGIQRRIIDFAVRNGDAKEGVSLARQLAMVSYRTPQEFAERFDGEPASAAGENYPVCDYLTARGDAYSMEPSRYIALSDSIDRHHVDATKIADRCLFVSASSDWLVPTQDTQQCAELTPRSEFSEINSLYGHDAFLKEHQQISPLIEKFLKDAI